MSFDNQNAPAQTQTHVHEFEESVKLAEEGEDRHNHRVAGVTSEVIEIGGGRHVHAIVGTTTTVDDHNHEFIFTTQIDSPLV